MIDYAKCFDSNKTNMTNITYNNIAINVTIKQYNKLLKKYNKI